MPIEAHAPELASIIALDEPIRQLAKVPDDGTWPLEGPVWYQDGNFLLMSYVRAGRRYQWSQVAGLSLVSESTNQGCGMTRDREGRLIVCEIGARRVTRQEPDGSVTVIARSYRGLPLNHPNDVVVKSDGAVYFTDPWGPFDGEPPGEQDQEYPGVYRVAPDASKITLLVRDFVFPNGLAFSPDEKILYINDYRRRLIRAFDVQPKGGLDLASDRVFCDLRGDRPGLPDGMKVDVEGNVYCGGAGGTWIIDPSGRHLGTIVHGDPATTNLAWGGGDWKTLFITTYHTLYGVRTRIAGVPVPAVEPEICA